MHITDLLRVTSHCLTHGNVHIAVLEDKLIIAWTELTHYECIILASLSCKIRALYARKAMYTVG